jgi:hypothetical protein
MVIPQAQFHCRSDFGVPFLVSYISQFMTLLPGDGQHRNARDVGLE